MKKSIFLLTVLILATGTVWGQYNDDRDLFVGVDMSGSIRPNIMILADTSGSMNTAIYHPLYDPKGDYFNDSTGALSLSGITSVGFSQYGSLDIYRISTNISFDICRPSGTGQWVGDASATFAGRIKKNDASRWKIYKSTVQGAFPYANQIIDYNCNSTGYCSQTRIILVEQGSDAGGAYWNIKVDTGFPGYLGDPITGSTIYINYHWDPSFPVKTAYFQPSGGTCPEGYTQFTNVKLYGKIDQNYTDGLTRYDKKYLYWLAFYASQQQLDEVTYWATTGKFPKNGVPVDFGYYRIEVMRRVLGDVMREVYTDVNLGIARFGDLYNGVYVEGFYKENNLTNFDSLESLDSKIKTTIGTFAAKSQTPLAESLADCWHYIIGQSPNVLHPHTTANVASDCPLTDYCQKQYVIVMTDGQSTYDEFTTSPHSRFNTSFFAKNPVNKSAGGWGDDDDHDPPYNGEFSWGGQPTTLLKPDGSSYCPDYSCWGVGGHSGNLGTDYLDDIAYYMAHNDHFPDSVFDPCYGLTGDELAACSLKDPSQPPGPENYTNAYKVYLKFYQGMQSIETYVIGFNADNDMLRETADNGNGEYYTASSYDDLKKALTAAIISIQLRNMAFAAFTAPKKITSTQGEGYSFIGYFMPSQVDTIWTGHLQSFKMTDYWYADLDGSGSLEKVNQDEQNEYVNPFNYEEQCTSANSGLTCLRSVQLENTPVWDTEIQLRNSTASRNLFTHDSGSPTPFVNIPFTLDNVHTLQPLFGLPDDEAPDTTYQTQAETIISTIGGKILGDVFHSDIAYIGAPMPGKKYVKNLNPVDCNEAPLEDDPDCFQFLLKHQAARDKVVYVGTNDGILHQVDALTGDERWGFIPDEVLPSMKSIVINTEYTYTVDGRLTADDIYYRKGTDKAWKTILAFGLKDGGDAFYCLDVTNADSDPVVLWKFQDDDYSGKSWSKPFVGKIRELQADSTVLDRWVVVLAGGMAFNNEDADETAGKAVFVIDASTGELVWMVGYNAGGAEDATGTVHIDTTAVGVRNLTQKPEFNYAIPSAITPVDRDSDGFLDTIYFGNMAGHLFKADISSANSAQWKTYQLYKKEGLHTAPQALTTISSIDPTDPKLITVAKATGFDVHRNVFGLSSKAMGRIDYVDKNILTVTTYSPSVFVTGETLVVPSYDPLFLSPAIFFDNCYNLWVAFGSGDRIRSRTNPDTGKFIALRDSTTTVSSATVQKTDILLSDLVPLTWTGTTMDPTNIKVENKWGWQFTFPMAWNHEKLFDPEPLVLPDLELVPHIYFNTYQPSTEETISDCDSPKNGLMYFYNLKMNYCGAGTMSGDMESGRIAGGGVFQGSDYILYVGKGDVASIPPLQDIKPIKLIYTGSMLFMKEKKR
jgi:hypothetical protein